MLNFRNVSKLLAVLALIAAGFASSAESADSDPVETLLSKLAPPPSDEALAAIPDFGRKLLALRSYVRAGSKLAKRWSWTDEEIEAFQGSAEQKALLAEVAAVSAHFAEANPGYEIYANTKVRSLDVQISHWNSNQSVGAAAEEILAGWTEKFGAKLEASAGPDEKEVRNWLSGFKGAKRSNLAAPGLTAHGQAHAIDFQVMKDGRIIAGADSHQIETVWRADRWDEKLKQSMDAAGPSFTGPLHSPEEPWHYHYDPEVVSE
ncbi:MAG: hypothetical protein R3D45_09425 [Rhizobiaceae bacterium]